MTYTTLRYDVEDAICTVTLDRPARLNAFTVEMAAEILAVLDRADADPEVRAVIFTGEGRAFCAGMDLSTGGNVFGLDESVDPLGPEAERIRDTGGTITLRIFRMTKPVIAAINGVGVGIGATMPLAMDARIVSSKARIGFVFAKIGVCMEACSSWFLPRLVGMQTALEWVYTGRVFGADEALSRGLVRSLHEPDDLMPAARALAREIADNTAPVSVALARQMMWRLHTADHPMEAHRVDSRAIVSRGKTDDVTEGVTAFLEKRPAAFPAKVSTDMPDFYPWWPDPRFR